MIIEEVAQLLQDEGIVTADNIFIGNLPDEPVNAILLTTGASLDQDKYIDVYNIVIDVWGRNSSFADGYDIVQEVFELLHRKSNFDLANYHIYFAQAIGSVEDLDRDITQAKLNRVSIKFIYKKI